MGSAHVFKVRFLRAHDPDILTCVRCHTTPTHQIVFYLVPRDPDTIKKKYEQFLHCFLKSSQERLKLLRKVCNIESRLLSVSKMLQGFLERQTNNIYLIFRGAESYPPREQKFW